MASTDRPIEITRRHFLTAGETDAQGRMPMWLIISRAIEIATEHANILGIGYARLLECGIGWVLTRMTVEMTRYPRINEEYTISTWIEGINRLYSDRCFAICDAAGNEIGYLRSMWVAIDIAKRTASDLTQLGTESLPLSDRKCPVVATRKLPPIGSDVEKREYCFKYSDLDFNRHVNTVQYVKHILNQWSLDFFDHHRIHRFEIGFHQECHIGEVVEICKEEKSPLAYQCEIQKAGTRAVAADIVFENYESLENK